MKLQEYGLARVSRVKDDWVYLEKFVHGVWTDLRGVRLVGVDENTYPHGTPLLLKEVDHRNERLLVDGADDLEPGAVIFFGGMGEA